jgi:hypothetical protein
MLLLLVPSSLSLSCNAYVPPGDPIELCFARTGCPDAYFGRECLDQRLSALPLTRDYPIVNIYVGDPDLELLTSLVIGKTLNFRPLNSGNIVAATVTLGGTNASTVLTSEIPLRVSNSSTDAEFQRIQFTGSGNFVSSWPHTNLRVNQISSELYFGSDQFRSVTIRNGGYPTATLLNVSASRRSGHWILGSATTVFPTLHQVVAPQRIALTGFAEPVRLLLSAGGLKVVFSSTGAAVFYDDYLKAGFRITYSRAVDRIEIGTDGSFTGVQSVLGGAYLEIVSSVTRPRIVVLEGAYPVGHNVHIQTVAGGNSPDFVLNAVNSGLSLNLAGPARLYLGVPGAHIREISGNAIATVRVVSNLPTISLYVKSLTLGTGATHFLSDDNSQLTLIVGDIPYSVTGLASDAHLTVQGSFRFSGQGQSPTDVAVNGSLSRTTFDGWVAADVPFPSLDVANGAVIRVPAGRTFFVNSSHTFPGTRYYIVLEGDTTPSAHPHPVLCAPALSCAKYELVFRNDRYYTHPADYLPISGGELAEEKCFAYSSLVSGFKNDSFTSSLHCVGYQVKGARRTGIVGPLTYTAFSQTTSQRSVWASELYPGARAVTIRGGVQPAGLSVNIDRSGLVGANLTLEPPSGTSTTVYFDTTALTAGHLSNFFINTPIEFLGTAIDGLSFPAPHVSFGVAQAGLNWSRFNFSGVRSLTVPFANWGTIAAPAQAVPDLTITGFESPATRVEFSAAGLALTPPISGTVYLTRPPTSSLTLTGWVLAPSRVDFVRTGSPTQRYDIEIVPSGTTLDVAFTGDWTAAANVTIRAADLTLLSGTSSVLGISLHANGVHLPSGTSVTFTGTVTTGTGTFTLTDAGAALPTTIDHLVWNAARFVHQCWNAGVVVTSGCPRLLVKSLTVNNGFRFNPASNISFSAVTLRGSGLIRADARQFNASHYIIHITRGSTGPTLVFEESSPVPAVPSFGEIEAEAGPESGDDILRRQATTGDAPTRHHLVCGTQLPCTAWRTAFAQSAARVRKWSGTTTSTFELTCTTDNLDIGFQLGDYYRTGLRLESGNFTAFSCLDYRELIVGGTPGSPHANFSDASGGGDVPDNHHHKKLSGGAIAGIVISIILVAVIVGLLLWICCCPPLRVRIFLKLRFGIGKGI